jgi:hypothetical protein
MKPKFLKPLEAPMGKPITVRLPQDVQIRYDKVKQRAENQGWTFSTTEIFVESIRDFCDEMETYMDNVEQQDHMAEADAQAKERSMKIRSVKAVKE